MSARTGIQFNQRLPHLGVLVTRVVLVSRCMIEWWNTFIVFARAFQVYQQNVPVLFWLPALYNASLISRRVAYPFFWSGGHFFVCNMQDDPLYKQVQC